METKNKRIVPFMAVHPGGIIADELEARGIKQKDFAKQIGVAQSNLSAVIHGRRDINKDLAEKLEQILGIDADLWLRLQAGYYEDLRLIREREREKNKEKEPIVMPLSDIIKLQKQVENMNNTLIAFISQLQKQNNIVLKK